LEGFNKETGKLVLGPASVHLTPEGSAALASRVAASIQRALGR
jgi:hypothetical protein